MFKNNSMEAHCVYCTFVSIDIFPKETNASVLNVDNFEERLFFFFWYHWITYYLLLINYYILTRNVITDTLCVLSVYDFFFGRFNILYTSCFQCNVFFSRLYSRAMLSYPVQILYIILLYFNLSLGIRLVVVWMIRTRTVDWRRSAL